MPLLCTAAGKNPAIEALVEQASHLPGEFAADALIRIAAMERVEPARKIELLEQAFQRASEAQQAFKLHASASTRDGGYMNRVYNQDLDRMSLQLRAIEALLPLDSRKARQRFLDIPALQLPELSCADTLVPDVSRYYEVLGTVARQTYTPLEVKQGTALQLLVYHAGTITSPVQAAPMARAVVAAGADADGLEALVLAYAAALAKLSGDDRSFAESRRVGEAVEALVAQCKKQQVSPLPLIESYQQYLVSHLSAKRCADGDAQPALSSFVSSSQSQGPTVSDFATYFNLNLRTGSVQPIGPDDVVPASVEPAATRTPTCQDADCRAAGDRYRALIFGADGTPLPTSSRTTTEWRNQFGEFLTALAGWSENGSGSAAQHFRDKSGFYADAFLLAPDGDAREQVTRALLSFLTQSRYQSENRVEWFLPANALIGRLTLEPLGMVRPAEALRRTGDPVIALYTSLELAAPRTPDRIMWLY